MAIKGIDQQTFEAVIIRMLSPTTPIRSPELLRGRNKLLEDIRRALIQPGRHIFIHGDRGVGKTSLAQTAAHQNRTADSPVVFLGCDNASTFFQIAHNLAQKLAPGTDPTVTKTVRAGKVGVGWKGFISGEAQQSVERGSIPFCQSIDEAISLIGYLAGRRSDQPIIVIDEFERIQDAAQRMLFADFIKQVGDQSVPIKLIFCGIGSALSDLLDSHHSCYRYLAAIPLERLGYQHRLEITDAAAAALGVKIEDTTQYRIAMISDGFPHYVHLLAEKLLWEIFIDPNPVTESRPHHYSSAVTAAVVDIEPHLKAMYEKASLKYKADYESVLWAVADDHQLKRRSSDIYLSYTRIMHSMREEPLTRDIFNQRMNALKKPAHASILKANRQGWYGFTEAVVRGYVRLRAENRGVQLGNEHPLEGNSPQSLANVVPSNVYRSRN